MDIEELNFSKEYSNFDDRIDLELDFYSDPKELSEPIGEEDSFYRHLEEY